MKHTVSQFRKNEQPAFVNIFRKKIIIIIFFFFNLFYNLNLFPVPLSFIKNYSSNMRDVDWSLLESENIQVYYDSKAYNMANFALNSVAEAYPYLSSLLGVKIGIRNNYSLISEDFLISNFSKIVLILGDRIEGPGFANPVTENIEAQMIHPRNSAFFQHELVHRLMYEHNDLHIGAPGRIFSLAMMPTWWIEGLAEYLTESIGTEQTTGIMRSMVLQDYWPSWESLHSLYNSDGDANLRGYVTSGQFLGWIFSQTKEKNLFRIQKKLSQKTFTPFFYSASENWLKENLNKKGEDVYEDFKLYQKEYWEKYLSKIPSLLDSKIGNPIFIENDPHKVYNNKENALISKLIKDTSPRQSSLQVFTSHTSTLSRIPFYSLSGSSIFAVNDENNGFLVTADEVIFENASFGHKIKVIKFNGNIFNIEEKNILQTYTIPFATIDNPLLIQEIEYAGKGNFFIHASLRGDSLIYVFNIHNNNFTNILKYEFPVFPKFIGKQKDEENENSVCILAIINKDQGKYSLEKICTSKDNKVLIPENRLSIIDGMVLQDGAIRLLTTWDKLLAFIDLKNGQISPVAAFPEWIQGTFEWNNNDNILTTWVYEQGKYKFYKIDINKLKNNYKNWVNRENGNPIFANFPNKYEYIPPYIKIFSSYTHSSNFHNINNKNSSILTRGDGEKKPTLSNQKTISTPAPYDHNFLFAFPYALPDVLGGPSINLVAIPYQDKMERDQIQIFGGYSFLLNAPSGTLSYINNRILDGFVASLFAAPFFNGTYTQPGQENKRYNYLLQKGISLANLMKSPSNSIQFKQVVSLASISPYNNYEQAPPSIGAQNTTLFSITESLLFNLFNSSYYLADSNKTNGNYLTSKTDMAVGGGKFNSINGSQNSQNNSTGNLDYYNLNISILSRYSFYKQQISLSGRFSTTQGPGTFNLKEYYSPYQTYILGSTASLNYVSYPLLSTDSLFDLKMGLWSGQTSINYEFPLSDGFESLFLMAYVNKWHGILSITEGGVSSNKDLTYIDKLTTLSVGTTLTLDIKGFQLHPSLFYSKLLENSGWGVIMQIKFMDFM